MKICFSLIPPFHGGQHLIMPLSFAYLSSVLKKQGFINIEVFDARLNFGSDNPLLSYKESLSGPYHDWFHFPNIDLAIGLLLKNDIDKESKHLLIQSYALRNNDFNFQRNIKDLTFNCKRWAKLLIKKNYDVLGFSLYHSNIISTLLVINFIRKEIGTQIHIILGGPQTSSEYLRSIIEKLNLIDCILVGEAENMIGKVLKRFENGEIKIGTLLASDFKPVSLEEIPYPDFSIYNTKDYISSSPMRILAIPIQSSRGCIANCKFCSERKLFYPYRQRNPESVIKEMNFQANFLGSSFFVFCDSLFNGTSKKIEKFCELLLKNEKKYYWWCYLRASVSSTEAKLLKKAGCFQTTVGTESFSDNTLKIMNKNRKTENNIDTITFLAENGIFTTIKRIVGYPNETKLDDFHTNLMLNDLIKNRIQDLGIISYKEEDFYFLPYSDFDKNHIAENLEFLNWSILLPSKFKDLEKLINRIPMVGWEKDAQISSITCQKYIKNKIILKKSSLGIKNFFSWIESINFHMLYEWFNENSLVTFAGFSILKKSNDNSRVLVPLSFDRKISSPTVNLTPWQAQLIIEMPKKAKYSDITQFLFNRYPEIFKNRDEEIINIIKKLIFLQSCQIEIGE